MRYIYTKKKTHYLFGLLFVIVFASCNQKRAVFNSPNKSVAVIFKGDNFIYYKISTIIKVLLANMTPRAFLPQPQISQNDGQLSFALNYEL